MTTYPYRRYDAGDGVTAEIKPNDDGTFDILLVRELEPVEVLTDLSQFEVDKRILLGRWQGIRE